MFVNLIADSNWQVSHIQLIATKAYWRDSVNSIHIFHGGRSPISNELPPRNIGGKVLHWIYILHGWMTDAFAKPFEFPRDITGALVLPARNHKHCCCCSPSSCFVMFWMSCIQILFSRRWKMLASYRPCTLEKIGP